MKNTEPVEPRFNSNAPDALGHVDDSQSAAPMPKNHFEYITDATRSEIAELQARGVDVRIVDSDLDGHYQQDGETQQKVDDAIATYSAIPGFGDILAKQNPAVAKWLDMAKAMSPLALHFFYNMGKMERPSDGLDEKAILDTPLPLKDGKTARELVRLGKNEKDADTILGRTEAFFQAGSLKEGVDEFGLTAYDIMAGSLDRIGDITRAKMMIALVKEHRNNTAEQHKQGGIVTASFGVGLAEPVLWLLAELQSDGQAVDTVHLVDMDPIALAASADRSVQYGLQDNIQMHMHMENIILTKPDKYTTPIEPGSVDVGEVMGVIEYFKKEVASRILKNLATTIKPGGMIVFGNMLQSRPQQEWFDGLWPPLKQRTISEIIEVIELSGLPRENITIWVSKDGLYAVCGIKFPVEPTAEVSNVSEGTARSLAQAASPASL